METTATTAMQPRALLDAVLSWAALGYGIYATAIEPIRSQDDYKIAIGIEAVILAVISLLWAGHRRNLGVALIVLGLSAPAIGYARAPLYWDETELFGEAFWTVVGVGAAVGLPLIAIGLFALLRARRAAPRPDPWWFLPLRWALQAGLLLIVVALRAGNWADGIPLVYAGAGLALVAMLIALPRRIAVTRRGTGLLMLFLGAGALVVIGVASASGGGNISEDEAMVGIIPAAIVAGLGLLLALTARRRQARPTASAAPVAEGVSADGLDGTVVDLLNTDPR